MSGLCGGAGKKVDGVFPGRSQSFRHQPRPVEYTILYYSIMTAAQDRGEWRRKAEKGPERFMAKWIAV